MPSAKYDFTLTGIDGVSTLATHTALRQTYGFTERQVIRATQGKVGKNPQGMTITAKLKAADGVGAIPRLPVRAPTYAPQEETQEARTAGIAVAI